MFRLRDLFNARQMSERLCCIINTQVVCVYCNAKLCLQCLWLPECTAEEAEYSSNSKPMHAFRVFDN